MYVSESKLAAQQANKSGDKVLRQRIMTLFGNLAGGENGRLVSKKNHLIGVWMSVSFIEQRVGGGKEVK